MIARRSEADLVEHARLLWRVFAAEGKAPDQVLASMLAWCDRADARGWYSRDEVAVIRCEAMRLGDDL